MLDKTNWVIPAGAEYPADTPPGIHHFFGLTEDKLVSSAWPNCNWDMSGWLIPTTDIYYGYVAKSSTHYYDKADHSIKPRLPNPAYLDGNIIRDIPPGSTVFVHDRDIDFPEGGDMEVEISIPGTYQIQVFGSNYEWLWSETMYMVIE